MKLQIGQSIKLFKKCFDVTDVVPLYTDGETVEELYILGGWGDMNSCVTETELDQFLEDGALG